LSSDSIDYQRLVEDALRDVVRRVLADVAEQGMPGDHHFYIGFRTGHPGVVMPRSLRDLYPEEMSLILQHQYWGLEVNDDGFAVELSFSGRRQRLEVPFAALTMFADPSAELALRFMPRIPGATAALPATTATASAADPASSPSTGGRSGPGEVIRFDPSRRK